MTKMVLRVDPKTPIVSILVVPKFSSQMFFSRDPLSVNEATTSTVDKNSPGGKEKEKEKAASEGHQEKAKKDIEEWTPLVAHLAKALIE